MKTDKDLSNEIIGNSTAVVEYKKNNKSIILISLLPIISVFTLFIACLLINKDILKIIQISILTFLLTTAMVFFIRKQEDILKVPFSIAIIFISYLISILLIILPNKPDIYSFWMIGGLLIAMLVNSKLGLLAYFNHTFILAMGGFLGLERTIHFLVLGILLSFLSEPLKRKSTVIYSAIILLSTNITLSFIMNNFIFESDSNVNYLMSFFSIFAVLVTAFLLSLLYDRMLSKYWCADEKTVDMPEANLQTMDNDIETDKEDHDQHYVPDINARTSFDVLLADDNELLLRMKDYSETLYNHCRLIGDLSARAANAIGAKEDLARAGGYYHEIGKLLGKDYIYEGLKLAEEYAFPKELKEIIKQHNISYDKPTSVEAAIVMISDNVVSTIEYIDKTGDQKFVSDKIIDNIFRMRMDKGTFDDSGLSVKDFKILKEFYQKEFVSKEREV